MKEFEKSIIKILKEYSMNDESGEYQVIGDWGFQNVAIVIADMVREKIKKAFKEIGE